MENEKNARDRLDKIVADARKYGMKFLKMMADSHDALMKEKGFVYAYNVMLEAVKFQLAGTIVLVLESMQVDDIPEVEKADLHDEIQTDLSVTVHEFMKKRMKGGKAIIIDRRKGEFHVGGKIYSDSMGRTGGFPWTTSKHHNNREGGTKDKEN